MGRASSIFTINVQSIIIPRTSTLVRKHNNGNGTKVLCCTYHYHECGFEMSLIMHSHEFISGSCSSNVLYIVSKDVVKFL